MEFRTKVEPVFVLVPGLATFVFAGVLPMLFINPPTSYVGILILLIWYGLGLSLLIWYATSGKIIFVRGHLLFKRGPFRSKVPYRNITNISPTTDRYTGYRISEADQGIELSLRSSSRKSIIFLPNDKWTFINELEKRCPHVQVYDREGWK